jgi:glutaredoxin
MTIIMVGAEQWCAPCKRMKELLGPIAYEMGVNLEIHDLGSKEERSEKVKILAENGIIVKGGIPAFFDENKNPIERPESPMLNNHKLREWLQNLKDNK